MDPFDNMGMQVAPPNGQLFNQCKWRHMVVKFWSNTSGAT